MVAAISVLVGLTILVGFGAFGTTSWREGETRAMRLAFGASLISVPFLLSPLLPAALQFVLVGLATITIVAGGILLLIPVGRVEPGPDDLGPLESSGAERGSAGGGE